MGPQVQILPLPLERERIRKVMCYLCLKDDPFTMKPLMTIHNKRQRAIEIKVLLKEAEEHETCYIGDATIARLKEEQYKLSRDM